MTPTHITIEQAGTPAVPYWRVRLHFDGPIARNYPHPVPCPAPGPPRPGRVWTRGPYNRERAFASLEAATKAARGAFPRVVICADRLLDSP